MSSVSTVPVFLAFCSLLVGGGLGAFGFRRLRTARIVAGKNPMRIGSVRGGFFAFRGKVTPLTPQSVLRSPHSGKECVYFDVLEEEWVAGERGKRQSEWRTVRHEQQAVDFLLDDGSGIARVAQEGAEWHLRVDLDRARSTVQTEGVQFSFGSRIASDHRRTTETYVVPGDQLLVIGQARPASGGAARSTISGDGAPVFLITDKPKGALLGRLKSMGYAACAGGAFFLVLPVLGLLLASGMQRNMRGAGPRPAATRASSAGAATPPPPVAVAIAMTGSHCRDLPVPGLDTIRAIGGRSSSDLWVAGDNGLLAHCDGRAWKVQRVGTRQLRGIALRPAGGVYVVGVEGTALAATREVATPLALSTTGGLFSIWTGPDGYGWAVGGVEGPTIVTEKEGVEWNHPAGFRYHSVDRPVIMRVQGDRWVEVPFESPYVLRSVWGASASDVWAGGDGGFLVHWDGTSWKKQKSPTQSSITAIAGSGAFGVFTASVYYHRYGTAWSHMRSEKTAGWAAWASSPTSAWTAATTGEVTRWDGNAWRTQRAAPGMAQNGAAIHGFSDDDVWIATGSRLAHWNGTSWKD